LFRYNSIPCNLKVCRELLF